MRKTLLKLAKEDSNFRKSLIAASKKRIVSDSGIRKSYYAFTDGLGDLTDLKHFQDTKGDEKLFKIIRNIEELETSLYKYLNENYENWD